MSIRETEPLPAPVVVSLYRGAVAVGGAAPAAVLCGARLGLGPAALRHLHEGWVDWAAGRLRVPAGEPCACRDCCETAREAAAETDESALSVLSDRCWEPPHGGRTVSFGWSRRLTAVLAHTLDRRRDREYTHDGRPFERGLAAAADAAAGVDPAGVDPRRLRATAAAFFARVGAERATLAALVGTDDDTARAFVRRHGTAAADALAARCGDPRTDGLDPDRFPSVADPTPLPDEPFDPRAFDAAWRAERAAGGDGRRLSNPRPSDVPPETDYDSARHGPVYRDYDDHVRRTDAGPVSTLPTRLRAEDDTTDSTAGDAMDSAKGNTTDSTAGDAMDSARDDTTDSTVEDTTDSTVEDTTDNTPGDTTNGAGDEADDPAPDSTTRGTTTPTSPPTRLDETDDPDESTATSDESPGSGAESTTGAGGPGGAGTDSPAETTGPRLGPDAGEASAAPRNRATEPIRLTESVRVAVAGLNGGQPTDARVVLGADEVVVAADETVTIPLSAVVDVAVDYVPDGMDDVFDDTVAVAYRRDGRRRLAVGEFPGRRQVDAADALFEALLADETVLVTHPARIGGRVTDERPRPCTVVPEGRRLAFHADGEPVTTIHPTELVHAERGRQRVADGGATRKAVKVRHHDGGDTVTTEFGAADDRLFRVLERRITHDYRRREERLRELDLSEAETETLVALYSAGDEMDVGMLLDVDPEGVGQILESLSARGLVDVEDDPGLTAMGETVVSERLDDVND